ncbi:hypothetical protein TKK_0011937 [Trichogramma kaykai]|uniref:Caveolin n=1 Tax=Trichogramma kaykai TaxID=54128 RepID=A0ABD2WQ35_9HYME
MKLYHRLFKSSSSTVADFIYKLYDENGNLSPYTRTAARVLLGWFVISSIWHVIVMLFAPAAVSALAIFVICPTTLEWLINKSKPCVEDAVYTVMRKLEFSKAAGLDI